MTMNPYSRDHQDVGHHVVVSKHDAFRPPRGTTRVHDAGQVVTWPQPHLGGQSRAGLSHQVPDIDASLYWFVDCDDKLGTGGRDGQE